MAQVVSCDGCGNFTIYFDRFESGMARQSDGSTVWDMCRQECAALAVHRGWPKV